MYAVEMIVVSLAGIGFVEWIDRRKPRFDWLGNSKTDNIVGLFRRTEIITGDKKTEQQIIKDKKINPLKQKGGLGFGFSSKSSLFSSKGKLKL